MNVYNFRDMMVLQIYFQSFDYETLILYQESFFDFVCEYLIPSNWIIYLLFLMCFKMSMAASQSKILIRIFSESVILKKVEFACQLAMETC